MELDFANKMQVIDTLARAGFHQNVIAVTLNRIEVVKEDIGVALLQAIILLQPKQNVECSNTIEQKKEELQENVECKEELQQNVE